MMEITPFALDGRRVRLAPLTLDHHEALCAVGLEPDLWRWTTLRLQMPDDMRR